MNAVNYFTLNDIIIKANEKNIKNIFMFSHVKHDGDAKGSALALVEYFNRKGFNSKYVITTEDFCLLDIFPKVDITNKCNEKFIAVSLDTSTKSGSENALYNNAEFIYKIDHHKNGEFFGDFNYADEEASSTCEIVSSMISDGDFTEKIATYLYTGIYTDTSGFKHSVRSNTFLQLAKLLRCKADYSFVVNTLKYVSSSRKKIEGLVAYNHKFFAKDVVGTIIRKYEHDYNALSVAKAVNTLTGIKAKVFFCCCESKTGAIFVEIRSSENCNIDVSKLAQNYGGGGHFHAAGFNVQKIEQIYDIIEEIEILARLH